MQHLLVEGLSRKLERVTLVCIYDILERKNTFLGYKKQEVQKVIKLTFFQSGLPILLVQKLLFFQVLFFRQYKLGKCLLQYSRTKKRLSRL